VIPVQRKPLIVAALISSTLSWFGRRRRRQSFRRRLLVESLEERTLLSGTSPLFNPSNNLGTTFATAQQIKLGPTDAATRPGTIAAPGSSTFYQFMASVSGQLVIRQDATSGSSLDSVLTVFDGNQNLIGFNDDSGGTLNSLVVVKVVAGQTYYIEASGFGTSTGGYLLTVTPFVDDFGNNPATAHAIVLDATGAGSQTGSIEIPGNIDLFKFTAPISGQLVIQQDATPDSNLDSVLTVLDSSMRQIAYNDDSAGTLNSLVVVNVTQGKTYYVQAAGFRDSIGDYLLTFSPLVNDTDNTFSSADTLTLDATGAANQPGTINYPGDVDYYRFVSPITGRLDIQLNATASSNLSSQLTVYDANQQEIAFNDNSRDSPNSEITLDVTAGQTYFLQAAGFLDSTGGYALVLTPLGPLPPADDIGDTFANAHTIALNGDGSGTQLGTIAVPGETDYFQFVAPATGGLTLREDPAAGGGLDTMLTVFDSAGNQIGFNDHFNGTTSSLVQTNVAAGQTYFAEVAGFQLSTGGYALSFSTAGPFSDGLGNTFADAPKIQLSDKNFGTFGGQVGALFYPGDTDLYEFVAPATGGLTVMQSTSPGSSLNSFVSAFDATGKPIGSNDDFGGSGVSLVRFNVTADQVYFVQAGGENATFGGYSLQLTLGQSFTDDFAHSFADAQPIGLDATGTGSQAGAINYAGGLNTPGESDVFQFVAPVTGRMTIHDDPTPGSGLISVLNVFDARHDRVATSDAIFDSEAVFSSTDVFNVVAGQTYFVQAAGFESTGSYVLTLRTKPVFPSVDDFGNTFATAHPVVLDALGAGAQSGTIEVSGEVDFFRVVAPRTGRLSVQQVAASGSSLDSVLTAFDGQQQQIAFDDDTGGTPNSRVVFDVIAGQTYFIEAAGFGPTTGGYNLTFQSAAPLADTPDNSFVTAQPVALDPSGAATVSDDLSTSGDADFFRFEAPVTGWMTVGQTATAPITGLESNLSVFDRTWQPLMVRAAVQGPETSAAEFYVRAGQTYYLQASGADATTGPYTLTLQTTSSFQDILGHTLATAQPVVLDKGGRGSVTATILSSSDSDFFQFVPRVTGLMQISMTPTAGSSLGSLLTIFDSSGLAVAGSSGSGAALAQLVVTAGQTYTIQAAGLGSTGDYGLSIAPTGDGFGRGFGSATAITLDATGAGSVGGSVANSFPNDVLQFIAPVTGGMTLSLQAAFGSTLQSVLSVFDSNQQPVGFNSGSDGSFNSLVRLNVTAGQSYYVEAGANGLSSGAYLLTLSTGAPFVPDFGTTFATASPITLDASGAGSQAGNLVVSGQTDFFQFVAPITGALLIRQDAPPGSSLDSVLTVFDSKQQAIAFSDDSGRTPNSLVAVNVVAGQTYYVESAGSTTSTGSFVLTSAGAQALALSGQGAGSQAGTLATPGQVDLYQFVAPTTGALTLSMTASSGSSLDSVLTVTDGTEVVGFNDDRDNSTRDSQVTINVVAGRTYLVLATGFQQSTGGYLLTVQPTTSFTDDFGSNFATAPVIAVKSDSGQQQGNLEVPGNVNLFQFTVDFSGPVLVTLDPAVGSTLIPAVVVYNSSRQQVAFKNDTGNKRDRLALFDAVAGQTFYVQVAASVGSGEFVVSIAPGGVAIAAPTGNPGPLDKDPTGRGKKEFGKREITSPVSPGPGGNGGVTGSGNGPIGGQTATGISGGSPFSTLSVPGLTATEDSTSALLASLLSVAARDNGQPGTVGSLGLETQANGLPLAFQNVLRPELLIALYSGTEEDKGSGLSPMEFAGQALRRWLPAAAEVWNSPGRLLDNLPVWQGLADGLGSAAKSLGVPDLADVAWQGSVQGLMEMGRSAWKAVLEGLESQFRRGPSRSAPVRKNAFGAPNRVGNDLPEISEVQADGHFVRPAPESQDGMSAPLAMLLILGTGAFGRRCTPDGEEGSN
jgi:hypothetical protein